MDCLVVLATYKQQAKYKEVTGKDFGPPPKEKKEKQKPQEQQAPSAKNAEKKAAKVCTHFAFHYLLCVCMCCAISLCNMMFSLVPIGISIIGCRQGCQGGQEGGPAC